MEWSQLLSNSFSNLFLSGFLSGMATEGACGWELESAHTQWFFLCLPSSLPDPGHFYGVGHGCSALCIQPHGSEVIAELIPQGTPRSLSLMWNNCAHVWSMHLSMVQCFKLCLVSLSGSKLSVCWATDAFPITQICWNLSPHDWLWLRAVKCVRWPGCSTMMHSGLSPV